MKKSLHVKIAAAKAARALPTSYLNIGRSLIKALKGPKNCRKVVLTSEVGCLPTIEYTCLVKDDGMYEELLHITKQIDVGGAIISRGDSIKLKR